MRFSIEIQNEPKMFFHSLPAAEKVTGLNRKTIQDVLERGNKVYHRKSDHKLFTISKEEPILVAKIEGEDFFSLEEIHEKLGLSPTRFLNQIKSGKFAKKIDWNFSLGMNLKLKRLTSWRFFGPSLKSIRKK